MVRVRPHKRVGWSLTVTMRCTSAAATFVLGKQAGKAAGTRWFTFDSGGAKGRRAGAAVKTLFAPFLISEGWRKHLQSVKSVSSEKGTHVSPRLTADRVQPLTIPSHHCQSGPGNQPTGNCLPVCCLC